MAATADRNMPVFGAGGVPVTTDYPVYQSTVIYKGTLVAINATGYLVEASDAANLTVVGMATEAKDNSSGNSGDLTCNVQQCVARWVNGTSITRSSVGLACYVSDNQTVATSGTVHSIVAGTIYQVDASGVWVYSGLSAPPVSGTDLTTFEALLASTANGAGAALVGIEDPNSLITGTVVEAALIEIVKKANAANSHPMILKEKLTACTSGAALLTYLATSSGKIGTFDASVAVIATTTAAATVIMKINGTTVGGASLALTTVNCATKGARVTGAAITSANSFVTGDSITVNVLSASTPFTEGEINFLPFFQSA